MALRNALSNLNEAIEDLTSLHVRTYTGTIEANIEAQTGIGTVHDAVNTAVSNGKVKLVAEAFYQFDGDSYNFLTDDADVPSQAIDLHKSAVEAGMATRRGLMELVRGVFD